jgi:serine/threonine-protein kinase RIO1
MSSNQTLDILVAEMLGDIGKLHDQVADLKVELPKILNQMQAVVTAQTAKADVLQEPIQRAIQSFIRQELKGISVAVKDAKEAAVYSFDVDVSNGVRKNLAWVQFKCKQSFELAAKQFDTSVTESAGVAESRATETLKGLCQVLKNSIDEIRAERWRGQYLSMFFACISSGLAVGILAVYILK